MIKRGISGIVLCFFCCVQCFPVFAQEIEQEIIIKEVWENTQESSENSLESSNSFDWEDNSQNVDAWNQEEEVPDETANEWVESENPDNWDESSEYSEADSGESWNNDDENLDENPDENNEETPEISFPEIFIDFQNPSYILEKDIQKQEYSCDPDQAECKVNIKILDENQSEILSDFWCEIIFSNSSEIFDCNPNSILFEESENTINIKLFEENNRENFVEKEIIILKNNISEDDSWENSGEDNSENWEENSWENWNEEWENPNENPDNSPEPENPSEWEDNSQNPDNGSGDWEENSWEDWNIGEVDWGEDNEEIPEVLQVPEIFLEIQSWAEISGDSLVCDKNNCSLNLNIEKSFEWDFIENNYICEWDFWWWNFSTQATDKKCNPGYVKYDVWEYQLLVNIIDKENLNNFSQKIFYVKNFKKSTNKWWSSWGNSDNKNSETENIIVDVSENKEIFVQSGLENNRCNEEKCSVNLQYKNASYEDCLWDFWEIETRDKYTKTCNPRNIYLPAGWHKITLSVKNNKTNTSHNKSLFIHNMYEEITEEKKYDFEIILQGKQTDFRKKIWDTIICLGVEKCNINLSVKQYKNLEYTWEFPNNFSVDKNNPKSVWFEIWEHNIVLKIYDGQKLLFSKNIWVQVIAPENTQEIINLAKQVESFEKSQNNYLWFFSELEIQPKNLVNLQDEAINYFTEIKRSTQKNFSHKIDSIDYFEIKDETSRIKLTRNISQQKKALKISGTTFPNSTVYIDDGEKIFTIKSDEIGKYQHKKQSDINSGNFLVDYYVIDEFWNYFQANNYKTISISDEYIWELTQNIQKKSTKSFKKKKISWTQEDKMKNIDAEKEINYASIWWISTNKMTFWQKILWMWICLIWFLWLFFVGRKYKIM